MSADAKRTHAVRGSAGIKSWLLLRSDLQWSLNLQAEYEEVSMGKERRGYRECCLPLQPPAAA